MISWIFVILTALLALLLNFTLTRPGLLSEEYTRYLLFATILAASVVITRFISYLFVKQVFPRVTGKHPSDLLRLLVGFITFTLALIANLYFVLDADISTLLTTSAVLTVVLGFALQATLGNLFEGLSVQIHQPFNLGDWIEFEDFEGTVESLTWRAVAIRCLDNSVVVIPNNVLAQSAIRVYHEVEPFQVSISFPAPIDTPPQTVRAVIVEALSALEDPKIYGVPEVIVKDFSQSGGTLLYQARALIGGEKTYIISSAKIRERIWYALARAGIPIPVPIEGRADAFKVPLVGSFQEHSYTEAKLEQLLAQTAVFSGMPKAVYEQLVQHANRLIFSEGEAVTSKTDSAVMFIVLRGVVVVPRAIETRREDERSLGYSWSPELLEMVRQHYAQHMGPVAEQLVKEAAHKTIDPYHLYTMLAAHIPSEEEQRVFLQARPKSPSREILPGDFFGERQLFTGEPLDKAPLAQQETELLEFRRANVRSIQENHPEFLEKVAKNLAQYYAVGEVEREALEVAIKRFYMYN